LRDGGKAVDGAAVTPGILASHEGALALAECDDFLRKYEACRATMRPVPTAMV
jgi:hypothetical protein